MLTQMGVVENTFFGHLVLDLAILFFINPSVKKETFKE